MRSFQNARTMHAQAKTGRKMDVSLRTIAVLFVALAGCMPLTGAGRARTLGAGKTEVSVSPEITLLSARLASGDVPLPSAQLAAGVHHGLTDRLDVGGRVWGFSLGKYVLESFGLGLGGKYQLKAEDPAPGGSRLAVALAPSLSYHQISLGGTPEHQVGGTLPLLLGWRVGTGGNQFVAGARIDYQVWMSESQMPLHVFLGGITTGFVWQISRRWSLVPELAMLYTPLRFNGESAAESGKGLTLLSLGVGVGYRW